MGCEVYANGMSIACKAADGKTIAAFPDVCMTPPMTPATPPGVPIPYPNTAIASDTADGSKTVMISGEEVMLKDKSCFKTSTGDEAGSAPKKGVITSKIKGKANFVAWSMDVKFEGENIPRHLDITLHNEASLPANTPTWPYLDAAAFSDSSHPCHTVATEMTTKCEKHVVKSKSGRANRKASTAAMCGDTACKEARKCVMMPETKTSCCDGKTPHHAVPAAEFLEVRVGSQRRGSPAVGNYKPGEAPCMCVEGPDHDSRELNPPYRLMEHGRLGAEFARLRNNALGSKTEYPYSQASEQAAQAVKNVTGCDDKCAKAQIDSGHRQMDVKDSDTLRRSPQKANVPDMLPPSNVPTLD